MEPTRLLDAATTRYRALGAWSDTTIPAALQAIVHAHPELTAVVDGPRRLSFADLATTAERFAEALHGAGARPGDVISVQLPGWWQTIAVSHAVFRLGCVLNPLLPSYRRRELSFILGQVEPRVMVIPDHWRGFDHAGLMRDLSLPGTTLLSADHDQDELSVVSGAGAAEPDGNLSPPVARADDVALALYTSGSTSDPKGVLHTHNTLLAEAKGVTRAHEVTADDVILYPMPFGHIGGILYTILVPMLTGCRAVLMDTWDPGRAIDLIEAERVTVQPGLPIFLRGMEHHPDFRGERVRSLRLFPMGGSSVAAADVLDASRVLGCVSKRTYGSTELPTLCTGVSSDTAANLAETEGFPIGANEIRIEDPAGNVVPPGESGEIVCRGAELCVGYLDPRLNEDAFDADGWFHTGDVGRLDDDGRLTVVGRLKDIIIRGGENITPKSIEDALLSHPAVDGVGVVGYPDPDYGERVCAVVATADPQFGFEDMIEHLRAGGLASFQLPERLLVWASLPYTATGKLDKAALRDAAAQRPVAT